MTPNESITGVVFDIQRYAVYDGPGIRTCVFLKGCPLRCAWCHNPESWRRAPEWAVGSERGAGGAGERLGREMTVDEVLAEVLVDRPFYETSGGGLTVSGGEPTHQHEFLRELLRAARAEGVHTAVETCGHFPASRLDELVENVDLFLFDLKLMDDARHAALTGVSNERILANFAALVTRAGKGGLLARIPLVPGVNVSAGDVEALIEFLRTTGYPGRVELMPYNNTARHKWEKVGRGDQFTEYGPLHDAVLERITAQLIQSGFEPFVNC